MPENIPSVSFDIGLGKYVDDIDVNYDALSQYMEQRGFSETEIADTSIHVSSEELVSVDRRNGHVYSTNGTYLREEKKIVLRPVTRAKRDTLIKEALDGTPHKAPSKNDDSSSVGRFNNRVDMFSSELMSQALVHELEHQKIHQQEGGMPEAAQYYKKDARKIVGKAALVSAALWSIYTSASELSDIHITNPIVATAAGVAMAGCGAFLVYRQRDQHQTYLDNPEEIRCRAAEESAPADLITIQSKATA